MRWTCSTAVRAFALVVVLAPGPALAASAPTPPRSDEVEATTTSKPPKRPGTTDAETSTTTPTTTTPTTTTLPAQVSGTWITAAGYNPEWHSINPPWLPRTPAGSGTGRRIVYSKGQQRVWLMEENGYIANTHLVSGRLDIPAYGLYHVYSKSLSTFATHNPSITWHYMVRFAVGPRGGGIGFHEIPWQYGRPVQTVEQLGQPLSGGCLRQTHEDSVLVWNWAPVGTPVVVVA